MGSQIPSTARLEIKCIGRESQYDVLFAWLRLHPTGFVVPFPDRWVNNVYFDSCNYSAFAANLSGASARTKVRYRWYGVSMGPEAGALEVKCKRNARSWKLTFPVPKSSYKPGSSWRAIRQELLAHLPPEGKVWLDANPFTVLINRYHRKYFVSSDSKVRVTIDTQIAVWDQRFKPYPNLNHSARLPRIVVVEFKFAPEDQKMVSKIIQGFPLRVSKHSKYISGVQAISPV